MFKAVSLISGLLALAGSLPAQVEPHAGQWKTWVIASGSAFRLPSPPDATATAAEIQWVKDCAATRNQTALAQIRFWDAGAPGYATGFGTALIFLLYVLQTLSACAG